MVPSPSKCILSLPLSHLPALCPQRLSFCQDTASLCIRQAGPGREDGEALRSDRLSRDHPPPSRPCCREGRDPHGHCAPTVCPAQNQMQQPRQITLVSPSSPLGQEPLSPLLDKKPDSVRPHSQGLLLQRGGKWVPEHISLQLRRKHPSGYPGASPKVLCRPVPAWPHSCSWERVKSPDAHLEWGPGTCAFSKPTNVSMHSQV